MTYVRTGCWDLSCSITEISKLEPTTENGNKKKKKKNSNETIYTNETKEKTNKNVSTSC